MKTPVPYLKNFTLINAPQALMRAGEKARQLAEQTGHRWLFARKLLHWQSKNNNVLCSWGIPRRALARACGQRAAGLPTLNQLHRWHKRHRGYGGAGE